MAARDPSELSALVRLIREGADADVQRFLALLRPPELADFLEMMDEEEDRRRAIRLMGAPLAAEVLREVEEWGRGEILEELSSKEIAPIIRESFSDDAADLIGSLPPDKAERTLGRLKDEERRQLQGLLEHEEDTAGGIMQTEVVTVPSDLTVQGAIDAVRGADIADVGEIHEVFVVDRDGRLVGSVSPADLLHEKPATPLRAVIEPDPIVVPVTMDQEDIARIVRANDLASVPVVDEEGVLVGQILHDDIADVIQEEATEDIAKMAGADPGEVYRDDLWRAIGSRVAWLVPAFVGGLLVALFLDGAEEDIRKQPILAAYLVVVVGMAGGVGIQNAALTVRLLALGRIELSSARALVLRQILTGAVLGMVFGVALFAFAMLTEGDRPHALLASTTLAIAIFTTITVGAMMGALVPILLERTGADPAIAASPFIQTANDIVGAGILIYTARVFGLLS